MPYSIYLERLINTSDRNITYDALQGNLASCKVLLPQTTVQEWDIILYPFDINTLIKYDMGNLAHMKMGLRRQ